MHGQGNYNSQVGQGPYPPPLSFQQQRPANPAVLPPPPPAFHHGPQPRGVQQGHPSFHQTTGIHAYQHGLPSAHEQGPPIPFPSNGMSSAQSHLTRPWSQNFPPTAAHLPPRSAYPLPSSQWNTMERGPPHQPPFHAPPPPPPPYSSSSSFMTSDPSIQKHSYLHPITQLPPPPPPPPPPSSPPGVPPLPSSSPPSVNILEEDLFNRDNLMLERPSFVELAEKSGPEVRSADAVVAYSPADSDMDMEDDITQPEEEKQNSLSNLNYDCVPITQEGYVKEQIRTVQQTGGHRLPPFPLDGNVMFAEPSVSKDEIGDCEAEIDDLGKTETGQTQQSFDVIVKESSGQCGEFSQSNASVASAETGCENHASQLVEGGDPFKLLQGYATDNTSENEGENPLGDVSSPSIKVGSLDFDSEKGCNFGSGNQSESNKHMLYKSMIGSPKNVIEADKMSFATRKNEDFSDKGHRDQESVSTDPHVALQQKDFLRDNDANSGLEGANLHNPDIKSNTKLNVDEFGRIVREGVSDSDTSDSPRYKSRHSRRVGKRSRSKSRSRSPHDRRRRRSPRRRNERRGRSRSLSPKMRRNRSRSLVSRRSNEFIADKPRQEKSQLPECFDFLRGKCYRGASCRYSHHESDKSERVRYNRGKQQYRDTTPTYEESKVLPNKEVKDKELVFHQDKPASIEVINAKETPLNPTTSPDVIASNLSGNENPPFRKSPSEYSDKVPQIIDRTDIKQDPTGPLHSVGSPVIKSHSTGEVLSQSLKEWAPSIANHPSQLPLPLPSVSQVSFSRPLTQDYNLMPHIARFQSTPGNYSPYQAPVSFQHSHFRGPSLAGSFLPPPPHSQTVNVITGEHSIPSLHMQQSLLPQQSALNSYTSIRAHSTELPNRSQTSQYQAYPSVQELDRRPHDNVLLSNRYVSNPTSHQSGPHITGEDHVTGTPEHRIETSQPFSHSKEMHSHNRPYFTQASYGMQYSATDGIFSQQAEPGNQPYVSDFVGSTISKRFNPYASTFDTPLSSKFRPNALVQENETPINTDYGAPFGSISVPVDGHNSKNKISSLSSAWLPESVLHKPGGDQYDPLFDSIEPASNSLSKVDRKKHEITGDSDDILRLNIEDIRQGGVTAISASNSIEIEEYGETAGAEVGTVLNESLSKSNDGADMNVGEVEIDQVKSSGKKKKGKDSRSMKLFKVSVAAFVKEVLKPSWRQGNMSKEAFKTIVKKTVDKVSGAMKSHHIPKSQAKINHYIDSSRGKLTKLVMGYVDKYVN